VTEPCHQQGLRRYDIKGSFLTDTKVDGTGPQVLDVKESADVILGTVGNGSGNSAKGIVGSATYPLFFAVSFIGECERRSCCALCCVLFQNEDDLWK
jgi:hypothetical protein